MKKQTTLSFFPKLQKKSTFSFSHGSITSPKPNSQTNFQNTYARSLFQQKSISLNNTNNKNTQSDALLSNKKREIIQSEVGKTIIYKPGTKSIIANRNKSIKDIDINQSIMKLENMNMKSEIITEMEKQIDQLRDQLKNEQSENEQLRIELKELSNKYDFIRNVNIEQQKQIHYFNTVNNSNEVQLQLSKKNIEIQNLKSAKENLERKLKNSEKEAAQYLKNCKNLQQQVQSGQKEVQKLQDNIKEIPKEINRRNSIYIEKEKEKQSEQITKLKKELEMERKEKKQALSQLDCVNEQLQNFYEVKPSREELLDQINDNDIEKMSLVQEVETLKEQQKQDKQQIEKLKQDYDNFEKMYEEVLKQNKQYKNSLDGAQEDRKSLQENYSLLINQLEVDQNTYKQNQMLVSKNLQQISTTNKNIENSLKCSLCRNIMENPVTIIPCGHNFCQKQCISGYDNGCGKCGKGSKVEAVYRNELLDEIIQIYKSIHQLEKILGYKQEIQVFNNMKAYKRVLRLPLNNIKNNQQQQQLNSNGSSCNFVIHTTPRQLKQQKYQIDENYYTEQTNKNGLQSQQQLQQNNNNNKSNNFYNINNLTQSLDNL